MYRIKKYTSERGRIRKVDELISIASRVGGATNTAIYGNPGTTMPIVIEFNSVYVKNNYLDAVRSRNKNKRAEEKLNTLNRTNTCCDDKKVIFTVTRVC